VVSAARPPAVALACAYFGSLSLIVGWTLSDTESPCPLAQVRNAAGSGNRLVFQFHPFHHCGLFQLVSTTSQSMGVKVSRNFGSRVFW
jgi:hypothetical protein